MEKEKITLTYSVFFMGLFYFFLAFIVHNLWNLVIGALGILLGFDLLMRREEEKK